MATRDPKIWMWAEACELLERAERLHRQFFQLGVSPERRPMWEPPVDVFETERELWIQVALPGVAAAQISVIVDGGLLIVAGDRPIPVETRRATIYRLEIPHGRFERRIELPSGRFEFAQQELIDGCLTLRLRKRQ